MTPSIYLWELTGEHLKLFLIVFGVAILFVIGSAAALRYFDGNPKKKKRDD